MFLEPVTLRRCHAILCAGLVLFLVFAIPVRPEEKPAKKKSSEPDKSKATETQKAAEDKAGVALSGDVSEDSAAPWRQIRFWLTVENKTTSRLEHVNLKTPEIAGFKLTQLCWPADSKTGCKDLTSGSPDRYELAPQLEPQQSLTVWGTLTPSESAREEKAFLSVDWTSNNNSSGRTITLGNVESLGWIRALALEVIHGWEWSFPLLAIFAKLIYDWWKKRKEAREQRKAQEEKNTKEREEKARSKKEHEAEELREQQKRTWDLMLPESHRMSQQYYMPIASAAVGTLYYLRRYVKENPKTETELQSAFLYFLKFHWNVRRLGRDCGNYHFKNQMAEEIVVGLFQKHRAQFDLDNVNVQMARDRALDGVDASFTLEDVINELEIPKSALLDFWGKFKLWAPATKVNVGGEEQDDEKLLVLDAFQKVLTYEANRPSQYWYGRSEPLTLSAVQAGILETVPGPTEEEVKSYIQNASRGE